MDEIEAKILGIDREAVEAKLSELGAEKVFDGEVHALFYDFPDRAFQKMKDVLRLRKVGEKAYLTYKRFVDDPIVKVRKEYESSVPDFDAARKVLESLGLSVSLEMRKRRTSYRLGGVHFELDRHLDQYSFVPEFLEIEAKDQETLYRYAGILGYGKEDLRPWTIIEISEYYAQE